MGLLGEAQELITVESKVLDVSNRTTASLLVVTVSPLRRSFIWITDSYCFLLLILLFFSLYFGNFIIIISSNMSSSPFFLSFWHFYYLNVSTLTLFFHMSWLFISYFLFVISLFLKGGLSQFSLLHH